MTIAEDLLDCGITERQFLSKKEDVQSLRKEGVVIHRPPMSKPNRILLILDLNGVLVHVANKLDLPLGFEPDTFISGKAIIRRPFCDDFLKFCFERFYVGVWSSRKKLNLVRRRFHYARKEGTGWHFVGTNPIALPPKLHIVDNIDKPCHVKRTGQTLG
ncbi:hypothetical protein IFM89_022161 [Coptis chinensis]|uniref:Mitochondrial import inner membrane translocase subunit TIM50 n=1 Tax=Coptis chinensis TaxID=261450 RepID=A0A835IX62_9MAGN|nr:hypothetical protein IFM89_022161 [Coptis chinensis]